MDENERFQRAVEGSKTLPPQSNQTLLDIYKYYKQATLGDVSGPKPGAFDFKGSAKYEAWSSLKGMGQDEAKQAYVELIESLLG